jgi:hypothetical protein
MRRPYPAGKVGSIKEKNPLVGSLVSMLFSIEKKISPPVGTSLLLMGIRERLIKLFSRSAQALLGCVPVR